MATEQNAAKDSEVQRRVRSQVKVMEAVLAQLSEEEEEIKRQKQDTEKDIHARYTEGLRHLGEARGQCLISLRDAAQVAQDKVEAERALTESKLDLLSQLAQSTDREGQDWKATQAVLLSPSALRHFQQLSQKTGSSKYFSYCPDHSLTPSLIYSCTQFMGAVLPADRPGDLAAGDTSTEAAPAPPDHLLSESHLTQQVLDLRTDMDSLRESQLTNINLLHDVTNLRADLERLEDSPISRLYRQLCNGLPSAWFLLLALCLLVTNLGFLRDIATLQESLDKLQTRLDSLDTKHARDIQRLAVEVQHSLAKSSAVVAFHASLIDEVWTGKERRLVLPNIEINTGGGYDSQTGIFTAPVSGTYLFLAGASVSRAGDSCETSFAIMLEEEEISWTFSVGCSIEIGCAIVEMTAGQRVWMQSEDGFYIMREWTYFSGLLLQATTK